MSSSGQGPWGGLAPVSGTVVKQQRPPLDLGPMTGEPEVIKSRAESLVRTFSALLGKELQLIEHPFGCTDCENWIKAPLSDPEGYLVVEHELSHPLFGTDLTLATAFRDKAVDRLFRRAKIAPKSPEAEGYKPKLDHMVHHLWNMLEDHRCRWLWAQLYPGGGEFLGQRWLDIAKYEMDEDDAKQDLLKYLTRLGAGIDTDTAPDNFKKCGKYLNKAKNLVEGVDAEACLAITARLVDDLADELLDKYPPNKKEEAKKKIQKLCSATSNNQSGPSGGEPDANPMGGKDLEPPTRRRKSDGKPLPPKKPTAAQLKKIQQVMTADDRDEDENGESSFSALLNAGANQMEKRLEDARAAMCKPKLTKSEEADSTLTSACKVANARGLFVDPTEKLPSPSTAAWRIRHQLERVKMRKRSRLMEDGDDIDIPSYIEAKLNRELDEAKLFKSVVKESGMELLLLGDVSGSMFFGYGVQLLNQAIADVVAACQPMSVKVHLWTFSDSVFFYRKPGSVINARGQIVGMTNMVQALDVAYEWAKKSKTTRAIILMTDGMPTSIRGRRSTGNALDDLHALLTEMRVDQVILSVLAIGKESSKDMYDRGFGKSTYGLLPNAAALSKALPHTAQKLVEAHIKKGVI